MYPNNYKNYLHYDDQITPPTPLPRRLFQMTSLAFMDSVGYDK